MASILIALIDKYLRFLKYKVLDIAQFITIDSAIKKRQNIQSICSTLRYKMNHVFLLYSIIKALLAIGNGRQFALQLLVSSIIGLNVYIIYTSKYNKRKNETHPNAKSNRILYDTLVWMPCIILLSLQQSQASVFLILQQYIIVNLIVDPCITPAIIIVIILSARNARYQVLIELIVSILPIFIIWRKMMSKYLFYSENCIRHLKNENMFKSILDSIDDPILIIDNKYKLTYQNEVCRTKFEIDPLSLEYNLKMFKSASCVTTTLYHLISDFIFKKRINCEDLFSIYTSTEKKYYKPVIFKINFKNKICVRLHDFTESASLSYLKIIEKTQKTVINTISHEMRTPLNGIVGPLQNALEMQDIVPAKDQMALALISAMVLQSKIDDFIDYSSIICTSFSINKIKFSVKDMLKFLSKICVRYVSSNVTLKFNVQKDLPDLIEHDRKRIQQILLKLLLNSIKYTKQGFVELCIRKYKLNMIRFEVIDTGCGIEDKVLSNLLTNSEIKETEVPDSSHLSGLGLTTVKMILKELGSELCIKSKQSEGSSFAFVLNYLHPMERKFTIVQDSPKKLRQNGSIDSIADDFFQTYNDENYKTDLLETLTDDFLFPPMRHPGILVFNSMEQIDQIPEEYNSAKAPDYMEVEPSNRSKSQRKQTSVIWEICVVDDNKMNRIVLCNYMKAFTMNSKEFINGKEIYDYMVTMLKTHNNALFSNQSIERKYLIFMDVNMPIMDGIESTRKIYELEGAHNCVAVIAVTAFTENSTRDDCIEVGMAKVLNKPVARSEFIEVMKLLVDESE